MNYKTIMTKLRVIGLCNGHLWSRLTLRLRDSGEHNKLNFMCICVLWIFLCVQQSLLAGFPKLFHEESSREFFLSFITLRSYFSSYFNDLKKPLMLKLKIPKIHTSWWAIITSHLVIKCWTIKKDREKQKQYRPCRDIWYGQKDMKRVVLKFSACFKVCMLEQNCALVCTSCSKIILWKDSFGQRLFSRSVVSHQLKCSLQNLLVQSSWPHLTIW